MEEDLIKLLESNHFPSNESEIISIINKKCFKKFSNSIQSLLVEIDEALKSDYMKKLENEFGKTEEESYLIKNEIQKAITSLELVKDKGKKTIDKSEEIAQTIMDRFNEINILEEEYRFREKHEKHMELISAIQSSLILDDVELASDYLKQLINDLELDSDDTSIGKKNILKKLATYHKLVKTELSKQFEECLKEISWPFISNSLQRTSSDMQIEKVQASSEKFSTNFQQLYLIEIPDKLYIEDNSTELINTTFTSNLKLERIAFPIQLLLRPLVKLFKFFFWSDSKVNKISKPEWYMTQVIQWIAVHHAVLGELFSESLLELVDGRLEFARGLVIMVMEKVHKDLVLISASSSKNDELFFHLIEEALTMTMDLRKSFDYPRNYPDPIDVICDCNQRFDNWTKLEQRFASKQLDEVFRSPGAWKALSRQCKRVECLNSFIGLINAMKERIHCISDISKQTRFCDVLLEVLDDFRRRLLQISKEYNANSQRWYDIMNVIYIVKILLRTWRLDQMFIGIYDYKESIRSSRCNSLGESNDGLSHSTASTETSNSKVASFTISSLYSNRTRAIENLKLSSDSIFSNVLKLYQHVLEEMEDQCIEAAFEDVSARADLYIKKSWLDIGSIVAPRLMSLSPSASGMFLVLRDHLHGLESALESELFEHVWQGLAIKFNKMLFDFVIRPHKFNELGASQLEFDIKKNLLPLFLPYTKKPERFFVKCLEACILLNLKCGTAMLIKEILSETLHNDDAGLVFSRSRPECPIKTLSEIGVLTLMPEDAETVLNLRIDTNLK